MSTYPMGYVRVVDEASTLLHIPACMVYPTNALNRSAVSICRLFMQGRCRQGVQCNQVHADIPTVLRLRQEVLSLPSCCKEHGQPCDFTGYPAGSDTVTVNNVTVPVERLAPTLALRRAFEGAAGQPLHLPVSLLCRLHHSGPICRYGSDCRFLHVCKDVYEAMERGESVPLRPTVCLSPVALSPRKISSGTADSDDTIGFNGSISMAEGIGSPATTPTRSPQWTVLGLAGPSCTPRGCSPARSASPATSTVSPRLYRHNPYCATP